MVFNSKLVVAGFAIFAIIFGSGNIVFPLIVGKSYPDYWYWASLGWFISAVLITFMGCYSAILYDADNRKLMSPLGKYITFLVVLCIMILTGPFGAMARSVTVSCDCIKTVFPTMNATAFKLVYCILMTAMAWNPGKLVDLVGRIFTPLKFGGLIGVVVLALYFKDPNMPTPDITTGATAALGNGLIMGYQTMDMLSAVMIMGTIYSYIKRSVPVQYQENKPYLHSAAVTAFIIAGLILAVVYTSLVFLSSQYSSMLQDTERSALFIRIAELSVGISGAWFVAVVIAVCCLATNIALTSVFSGYLQNEICRGKVNDKLLIVITGIATFCTSLLGFDKIFNLMAKVLTYLYPALIAFFVMQWIRYRINHKNASSVS